MLLLQLSSVCTACSASAKVTRSFSCTFSAVLFTDVALFIAAVEGMSELLVEDV